MTLAWHFLPDDGMTADHTGDTLRQKVQAGQTLTVKPPVIPCENGLHWSRRAIDALRYAPGAIICRVRASGEIEEETDKGCSSERTCIAMADAITTLHEFAVWSARGALTREREAGRKPDPRSWAALEVKERWIRGEATDGELAVAESAARAAARAAAEYSAVYSAASAAESAARAAAWYSAEYAAGDSQNEELERRLFILLGIDTTTGGSQ